MQMKELKSKSNRASKTVLRPEQAAHIYSLKPVFDALEKIGMMSDAESQSKGRSVPLATMFNVSAKTIRDIWNRKTWTFATRHLWKQEKTIQRLGRESPQAHSQVINVM